MKLVKKLLRLLPFIYLFASILIVSFTHVYSVDNFNILNYFESLLVSNKIMSVPNTFKSLFNWLRLNLWFDNSFELSGQYIYTFVFNTLIYELLLSIMFIMFDVFNFMLSVAERFINKGERSND